jgi:arylsulfatase A-like enzyme
MNLILVTLDCVRASHLGCYGYTGTDTPFIDRIAAEGVLFENAFCQTPNTWVSHASILTGCYPNTHGLRHYLDPLSPQVPRLAQMLQAAGFATAGFPAHNLVGAIRGFHLGFDLFDEEDLLHDSLLVEGFKQHRSWKPTREKAFRWMLHQERPFFLWLHYMDTHWEPPDSLSVPQSFRDRYSPVGQFYDAKISFADQECIGALWDFLSANDLLDQTVFVVTADHGEEDLHKNDDPSLGSAHGGRLVEAVMRVPLIIRAPGVVPAGKRVAQVVRLVDFVPTVLNLLAVGGSLPVFDGVDLAPAWSGTDHPALTLWAYLENVAEGYAGVRTDSWKLELRVGMPVPMRRPLPIRLFRRLLRLARNVLPDKSVRETPPVSHAPRYGEWVKLGTEGFYAIPDDPHEDSDLSGDPRFAAIQSALEEFVLRMFRQESRFASGLSLSDKEELGRTLKHLGYV